MNTLTGSRNPAAHLPFPGEALAGIPFVQADGRKTSLADFAGQVVLIVNVASRCGLTPQYEELVHVQGKYRKLGFTVLAFPSNDFAGQEPGTDAEIQSFCRLTYGVDFPVMAKIAVKGESIHPLYRRLTQACPRAIEGIGALRLRLKQAGLIGSPGEVLWNFEKFLVGRRGEVVARFAPDITPEDPMIRAAIEVELAKP